MWLLRCTVWLLTGQSQKNQCQVSAILVYKYDLGFRFYLPGENCSSNRKLECKKIVIIYKSKKVECVVVVYCKVCAKFRFEESNPIHPFLHGFSPTLLFSLKTFNLNSDALNLNCSSASCLFQKLNWNKINVQFKSEGNSAFGLCAYHIILLNKKSIHHKQVCFYAHFENYLGFSIQHFYAILLNSHKNTWKLCKMSYSLCSR